MDDLEPEKDNKEIIKENNNKDNKEQNNSSNQNQKNNEKIISNSISKSFESEKNDKQENNNKEEIKNKIIEKAEIKNNDEKKEEQNLNNNIEDEKDQKKDNINKEKKVKEKYINEDIVRESNKKPALGPVVKSQLKPSINKIKNKSIEKTIKTLLNTDENNNQNGEQNDNKNKFMDRLNEFKRELTEKEEMNKLIQKKNIFEFTFKNYEDNKINKFYYNKDLDNFYFNVKDSLKDKKFKELEDKYFKSNKFFFSNNKDFNYNQNIFLEKEKPITSYKNHLKKNLIDNYNCKILSNKPIIYQKNSSNIGNNIQNNEIFKLMNSVNNFNVILNKFRKTKDFDFQKNNNENNKFDYLSHSANKNKYKNYYNNKIRPFNSSIFENSKKLQNLMNDVLYEINQNTKKSSSKKYEFKSRLSNIKSKMKSQSVNKYNKKSIRKNQMNINRYTPKKSKNLKFEELLNLCSKENLKSHYKIQAKLL